MIGDKISSTTYHLIAVSHHLGQSLSKGRYTITLIDLRRKRKFMWRYNDKSVSKTRYLDEQTAYILFYREEKDLVNSLTTNEHVKATFSIL